MIRIKTDKVTRHCMVALLAITALVFCLGAVPGCDSAKKSTGTEAGAGPTTVAATNYPVYFFASRIGGDDIKIIFPIAEDGERGDPAFWKPSANAITEMQKADRVLANGAGYESWLQTVTLPDSKIVRTSDSFKSNWITEEGSVEHKHGPEGEAHSHGETAFTTWLNIDFAIKQARSVCDALSNLSPDHQSDFESRFSELESDLRGLRKQLLELGPPLADQHLLGSHPVYQYLQSSLNLKMHSVHFEPDTDPSDEQWKGLDDILASYPTKLMLWVGEPTIATREALTERGVSVVVFDPMGNQPTEGDFVSGMQKNIDRLKSAINR